LRSGESIEEAVSLLADLDIAAFFFNCTHPLAIESALKELRTLTDKPLGAYPNNMNEVPEGWTLDEGHIDGARDWRPETFVLAAKKLIDAGATIIGGCCGIGPDSIAALTKELKRT
jgi:S-methylmethionine-dependent homocysteine/selenocysteine methylase